ncbi:MAG TPA: hypothetical protein VF792_11050 [Ktedonobacterales bacterium]
MEQFDAPNQGQGDAVVAPEWRGWMGATLMITLVVGLVAGFSVVLLSRHGGLSPAPGNPMSSQVASVSSATWQSYHDPLGAFSMRLPPGWTATVHTGSYSEGGRDGSFGGQDEMVQFSDPTLGAASASISVNAMPFPNTPVAHAMMCNGRASETATFNGYPATDRLIAVIMFESGGAHFQIDEVIPGVLVPMHSGGPLILTPPPTPTPLPASTVSADKALLDAALATFQPTDPKPLTCP